MDLGKQSLREALHHTVFHNIRTPHKELSELSECFIRRTIPRNTMLVRAGDRWKTVFYIHQGILRLFKVIGFVKTIHRDL